MYFVSINKHYLALKGPPKQHNIYISMHKKRILILFMTFELYKK